MMKNRKAIITLHASAGILAWLLMWSFFTSSLVAELTGKATLILQVKTYIFYALPLMILLMPMAGISGTKLGGPSRHSTVLAKKRRMKFIAGNGLILITLASLLYFRVQAGKIDVTFHVLQVAEFIFGAANIILMGWMIRDGLFLSGRLKKMRKVVS
jgi:hypothetical protein